MPTLITVTTTSLLVARASIMPGGILAQLLPTDGVHAVTPGQTVNVKFAADAPTKALADALVAAVNAAAGKTGVPSMLQISQPDPTKPGALRADYPETVDGKPTLTIYKLADVSAVAPIFAAWAALSDALVGKAV
jgi:hypothetical protein